MRQTGFSLVMEDRQKARVAAPLPNRARTVAWANGARILQGRANNSQEVLMEQEAIYVGIDVAKAQLDVAVRPTDDRWEVSHDDAGVRQLVSRLKAIEPAMVLLEAAGGFWRPGTAAGGCPGSPLGAGGRRQPPPSAGLRQGHREAGQDRRSGRSGPGSLRRSSPPARAPSSRHRDSGPQLPGCPQAPGDDHAGLGEEPPELRHHCRPSPHRGSHCMARAGAGRSGRGPASDSPSESRMAGEG